MLGRPLGAVSRRVSGRQYHSNGRFSSLVRPRSSQEYILKSGVALNRRPRDCRLLASAVSAGQATPSFSSRDETTVFTVDFNAISTSAPFLSVNVPVSSYMSVSMSPTSAALRRGRQKRWMSSSSNDGKKKKDDDSGSKSDETAATPPSEGSKEASHETPDGAPTGTTTNPLSSIVQSVGPTLRKVTEWNLGDLASVLGIVVLILLIIVAPSVVEQMRASDSTYGDFIDIDDPVALMDKVIREEKLGYKIGEGAGLRVAEEDPDRKAVDNTVNMVADVLNSETLQEAIVSLINRVLESTQFQNACQRLLKNLWDDLVNDPETTTQVVQLLNNAIQNKEIQRSVKRLVMQIIDDPEVYDELTRLLVRLGQEKEVLKATQDLLAESAHHTLNDPEILDHSMEFATDVVGDDIVQRTSGEALRNTVGYAVSPTISVLLSILGVGLLIFSISAFGNSRASEQEAEVVDRAMTALAQSAQKGANEVVSMLLALPRRLLSMCGSFLVSIATFPFKVAQRLVSRLEKAGGSTATLISSLLASVASWPAALANASLVLLERWGYHVTNTMSSLLERLGSMVGDSFAGSAARAIGQAGSSVVATISKHLSSFSDATVVVWSTISSALGAVLTKSSGLCGSIVESSSKLAGTVITTCQAVLRRTTIRLGRIDTWLTDWSISVASKMEVISTPIQKGAIVAFEQLSKSVGVVISWISSRIQQRRDGNSGGDSAATI